MFGIPAILAFTVTGISWWSKPNTRYEFVPAISSTIEQQVTNAYANALRKYGDTDGDCTVLDCVISKEEEYRFDKALLEPYGAKFAEGRAVFNDGREVPKPILLEWILSYKPQK